MPNLNCCGGDEKRYLTCFLEYPGDITLETMMRERFAKILIY
jgi:hypothetical protein